MYEQGETNVDIHYLTHLSNLKILKLHYMISIKHFKTPNKNNLTS